MVGRKDRLTARVTESAWSTDSSDGPRHLPYGGIIPVQPTRFVIPDGIGTQPHHSPSPPANRTEAAPEDEVMQTEGNITVKSNPVDRTTSP